jgi:hypothetical protein
MINNLYKQLNDLCSRHHGLVLIGIITLGLLLRLYVAIVGEGYHYFSIKDEVNALRVALSFLAGEESAFYIGQPNFANGNAPGPVWTLYWVALFELAGHNVQRTIILTAILNTAVVYLGYRIARHFLQPVYALFATFLLATSPWSVYYTVGLWNPFPMAMLGAFLILALWNTTSNENSGMVFWVGLITAVIPQFHMIGIFYIPTIILFLVLSPARIHRGWLLAGIIAGIAVYIPYIIGDMGNNWENTRQIFGAGKRFSLSVLKILTAPITVLSNHPGRWVSDDFKYFIEYANTWFGSYILLIIINLISMIMGLVVIIKFITPLFSVIKNNWRNPRVAFKEHHKMLFVGLFLVFPLLTFILTGHNYSTRYTILIFPLLFMLPSFYLQNGKSTKFKQFYIYTLPFMIIVNFYLLFSFYAFQANQIESDDYFVASFNKMELVRQSIKEHAGSEAYIIINPDKFTKDAPDKLRTSVIALTNYMDAIETYEAHMDKPITTKTYLLSSTIERNQTDASIAYQDNIITIKEIN